MRLLFDVASLKNPAGQASHWGWAEAVPIAFVYFPGGHLVWASQWTLKQRVNGVIVPGGVVCAFCGVRVGHPAVANPDPDPIANLSLALTLALTLTQVSL